jgi:hypothetical protein
VARALDVLHRYLETRDAEEVVARSIAGAAPGGSPSPGGSAGREEAPTLGRKDSGPGPGDLVVSGDYRYSEPRLRYRHYPASTFVPLDNTGQLEMSRGVTYAHLLDGGGGDPVMASSAQVRLALPDGASVTELRCYYWDKGSPNLQSAIIRFDRRAAGSPSDELVGGVSITTENIIQLGIASESSPVDPPVVIDNESFVYTLTVHWRVDEVGDDARFYGCRLGYEHAVVAP